MNYKYTVEGFASEDTSRGCAADCGEDRLADAKERARQYVSPRFGEESALVYARVLDRNGDCVWDIFGKH